MTTIETRMQWATATGGIDAPWRSARTAMAMAPPGNRGEERGLAVDAPDAAQRQRAEPADHEGRRGGKRDGAEICAQHGNHRRREIERNRGAQDDLTGLAPERNRIDLHAHEVDRGEGDHRSDHPRVHSSSSSTQG